MTDYLKLDADAVRQHIEALFVVYPEIKDDEALRDGIITGETNLDKVIERALAQKVDADIMVNGIADAVSSLTERSGRFERKSDAMRALIRSLMLSANLKSLPLPMGTVSVSAGRESVNVFDASQLPQGYVTIKTTETPDKKAIMASLKNGEAIPGAEIQVGEPTLTIRRV